MPTYASQTTVAPERSRMEIERTLKRYGASGFGYAWEDDKAMIAFKANGKQVRFILPIPSVDEFRRTPTGLSRTRAQADKAHDQGIKQRWRALALSVKAKLEAVEAQIVTFDEEFLAHIVLPDGRTVAETLGPEMEFLGTRQLPSLLPGSTSDGDHAELLEGEVVA